MHRFRSSVLFVAAFLLTVASVQGQSTQSQPTFRVSTVKDFLSAVGSNRTIVLAKGDYLLSTGYGYKSSFVTWNSYDDGKELGIHNAVNLTIRGMDGARLVCDAATAYIIGIYGGRNVTLDNLVIERRTKEGAEVSGGSLYAESVQGLFVDRSEFTGPTTDAVELSGVDNVRITRSQIEDCSSSALSVTSSSGLELSNCAVLQNSGYPLFYLEDTDQVAFKNDRVQGNEGGNLIEIYAESGSVESVVFSACAFAGNKVDYFSGTALVPETNGCTFAGNSFGEDWATSSVAASSDESSYDEDNGPAYYEHYGSGLAFEYPQSWEIQEKTDKSRVGLFSPDGETVVLFTTAYALPAGADASSQSALLFSRGADALVGLLKNDVGVMASLTAAGTPFDAGGIDAEDFTGTATKAEGGKAYLRVRLFISKDAVQAMVGMAKDSATLDEGTEADSIFASVQEIQDQQ